MDEKIVSLLGELKVESEKADCPEIVKDIFKTKYGQTVPFTTEFDKVLKLVSLYSYIRYLRGDSESMLRSQLLNLLTLYVISGGSTKESRETARVTFEVKPNSINSMNLELRNHGHMTKNPMKTGDDKPNSDLMKLKKLLDSGSDISQIFTVKFKPVNES